MNGPRTSHHVHSGMSTAAFIAILLVTALASLVMLTAGVARAEQGPQDQTRRDHLRRAKIYLAAGDYRRALEACQREVDEAPSAQSYVYLTYVLQAIDGYLEHLSKADRWVQVEHLFLNLAMRRPEDLVDPPEALARIAKEIIQESARRQSDIAAAMAARLDEATVAQLWKQQTAWRKAKPESWWAGVPEEWGW